MIIVRKRIIIGHVWVNDELCGYVLEKEKIKITNNLKLHRENRKLSQAELAEMLDINERTYQYIECGESKPNIEIVLRLAQIFNVKVEDLFNIQKYDYSESDIIWI